MDRKPPRPPPPSTPAIHTSNATNFAAIAEPARPSPLRSSSSPSSSMTNNSDAAPVLALRDFVARAGGSRAITRVLIANNGMAAVKAIRSIRKWAYETFGDERLIEFTAMATPEDLHMNAEYIRMADHYIQVPGGTANNNYSNVNLIVDIAARTRVHAVWVGWGFASENPVLSERLPAGVVFVGPPPAAMRSLGDKIASTIVAQSANVPCVDWSGSGITIDTTSDASSAGNASVPDDLYKAATTHDVQQGLTHARRIGFPVMIKASEGGGGKGIRLVDDESAFAPAFVQVQREVPGSPIFIMRVVRNARHLEVQLIADAYGNAIALFGRDCSVQRRHQKIIEEAPISVAPPEILEHMERSAVRLAKLVGYVSAGTVEYLYEPATKKYYFLELNPRLQVEHPTTEMVSGVNIPAAQLQIAMGIPLNNIKDIRILYGLTPTGTSAIDFDFASPASLQIQRKPSPRGHVIATRITAENPDAGFKPNSGRVFELNFRSNSNVWGYFSVNASGGVHEFADSQFGHIFSYGETREDARKNLIVALKEISIRGEFRTTVEYLVKLLENQVYVFNEFTTQWLDELISKRVKAESPDNLLAAISGAVVKAHTSFSKSTGEYRLALEKGQTPPTTLLKTLFPVQFIIDNVQFNMTVSITGPENFTVSMNKSVVMVHSKPLADGGYLVLLDGHSHVVYTKEEPHATQLTIRGKTCLLEKENDPTKLHSPSPGKLVRFLVPDGHHLKSGDAFAEIEVMKMYMPLVASESGIVRFEKPSGSVLTAGDIIGTLVLDDPSRVQRPSLFDGRFPKYGEPQTIGDKVHQQYKHVLATIEYILDGYEFRDDIPGLVKVLYDLLRDRELPFFELNDVLASLVGRIPAKLEMALQATLEKARCVAAAFPAREILSDMEAALIAAQLDERIVLSETLLAVRTLVEQYTGGLEQHARNVIIHLLERYITVERIFNSARYDTALLELREKHKDNLDSVLHYALASSKDKTRSDVVLALLRLIRDDNAEAKKMFMPFIQTIADFKGTSTAKVSLKARELLIYYQLPSAEERRAIIRSQLRAAIVPRRSDGMDMGVSHDGIVAATMANTTTSATAAAAAEAATGVLATLPQTYNYSALTGLIMAKESVLDILPGFFYDKDEAVRAVAFYTYVLHTFQAYSITSIKQHSGSTPTVFTWEFVLRQTALVASGVSSGGGLSALQRASSRTSFADLSGMGSGSSNSSAYAADMSEPRRGVVCAFNDLDEMQSKFLSMLNQYSTSEPDNDGRALSHIWNVAIRDTVDESQTDEQLRVAFDMFVCSIAHELRLSFVRRITFMVVRDGQFPRYFTFKATRGYTEDAILRHIEPAMAYQLEFQSLANFDVKPCFVDNRRVHIYYGIGKKNPADVRFFIRAIMHPGHILSSVRTLDFLVSEGNRIISDALDAVEVLSATHPNTDCNHLFLNIIPTFQLDLDEIEASLRGFVDRHGQRMFKLRVTTAEVRFLRQLPGCDTIQPIRFIITSNSGFVLQIQAYREVLDVTGIRKLVSLSSPPGPQHNQPVSAPYAPKEAIQPKRYKAHLMGTTYVYDFPELFRRALEKAWIRTTGEQGNKPPAVVMTATELILNNQGDLEPTYLPPGSNTCGMVVWEFELLTPEYPEGRSIIVIANDITFNIGSFGPAEDLVFMRASQYARRKGIPRIYISANSGARIGLAEEVASRFKIAWVDASDPAKGFEYLYLDPSDYDTLVRQAAAKNQAPPVDIERIVVDGGVERCKLTTVIGLTHGIGVENLQGSGMIAGETSRAYEDIFTLTLVTCRSVGIGAYLVRLGQRVIQVQYTPIILTGAAALNKVLGRNVYTSNLQLGGTQIMHRNGVSHLVAENEMEGVHQILTWLSYVPKCRDAPLPIVASTDTIERPIEVEIPNSAYDPRVLLCGRDGAADPDGEASGSGTGAWLGGFFDRGSFTETLAGWAKGIVSGRARLGGIPVGVIAVETRATEHVVWADPAVDSSREQTNLEAGQVWYPNSSFKTAQAIRDFNNGEQLPLIIFANWRGFSGGQSDMYKEILKFGAYIVDALRAYCQPVFVYLIGELRGGAWVVLDPTINSDMMEMYVSENGRGGVLEPEGIVEIKFRKPQLLAAIQRLDEPYRALKRQLDAAASARESREVREALQANLDARERHVLPVYHQAAIEFADLHDRPRRMLAKRVVRRIVPWRESRNAFYWRLLRRISEMNIAKLIQQALGPDAAFSDARAMLGAWYTESACRINGGAVSAHGVGDGIHDGASDTPLSVADSNSNMGGRHGRVAATSTSSTASGGISNHHGNSTNPAHAQFNTADVEDGRDIDFVRWLDHTRQSIDARIAAIADERRATDARALARQSPAVFASALADVADSLDADTRRKVLEALGITSTATIN